MNQLTNRQLERQDYVDNEIFDVVKELHRSEEELEWDIELISEIREIIQNYLVERGLTTEMDFYPYLDEEHKPVCDDCGIEIGTEEHTEDCGTHDGVLLMASGYEWTCPSCGRLQHNPQIEQWVTCKACKKRHGVIDESHARG